MTKESKTYIVKECTNNILSGLFHILAWNVFYYAQYVMYYVITVYKERKMGNMDEYRTGWKVCVKN